MFGRMSNEGRLGLIEEVETIKNVKTSRLFQYLVDLTGSFN